MSSSMARSIQMPGMRRSGRSRVCDQRPVAGLHDQRQGMGREVRVSRGARLNVSALAQLNPDMDRLGRIELVAHDEVIATVSANGSDRAQLNEVLTADESMWVAVRAFGEQAVPEQGPVRALCGACPQRADLRHRRRPAVLEDRGGARARGGAAADSQ